MRIRRSVIQLPEKNYTLGKKKGDREEEKHWSDLCGWFTWLWEKGLPVIPYMDTTSRERVKLRHDAKALTRQHPARNMTAVPLNTTGTCVCVVSNHFSACSSEIFSTWQENYYQHCAEWHSSLLCSFQSFSIRLPLSLSFLKAP